MVVNDSFLSCHGNNLWCSQLLWGFLCLTPYSCLLQWQHDIPNHWQMATRQFVDFGNLFRQTTIRILILITCQEPTGDMWVLLTKQWTYLSISLKKVVTCIASGPTVLKNFLLTKHETNLSILFLKMSNLGCQWCWRFNGSKLLQSVKAQECESAMHH